MKHKQPLFNVLRIFFHSIRPNRLYLLLIFLLLVVYMVFVRSILSFLYQQQPIEKSLSFYTHNIPPQRSNYIDLSIELIPQAQGNIYYPQFQINITRLIYINGETISSDNKPNQICIDAINVYQFVDTVKMDIPIGDYLEGKSPLCVNTSSQLHGYSAYFDLNNFTGQPINLTKYSIYNYPFFYPFITENYQVEFEIQYFMINNGAKSEKNSSPPNIWISTKDLPMWDFGFSGHENEKTASLQIKMTGLFYYRVFSIVLIIGMIILIGFLFTINQTSSFVQASAAILFGLFGVRQILLPKDLPGQTIWDLMVFVLYIFVVYAVFDHLLFKVVKLKKTSKKYKFVGSPSVKVYHRIDCKYSKRIPSKNRIFYSNEDDAIKDKRVLCKICSLKK